MWLYHARTRRAHCIGKMKLVLMVRSVHTMRQTSCQKATGTNNALDIRVINSQGFGHLHVPVISEDCRRTSHWQFSRNSFKMSYSLLEDTEISFSLLYSTGQWKGWEKDGYGRMHYSENHESIHILVNSENSVQSRRHRRLGFWRIEL